MKKSKKAKVSEHEDGVDMIGNLPDPILHKILSGLPTTEEVMRTSILSTRWRHLWSSVSSIDVDYSRGPKAPQKFKNFVDSVLANKSIDLDGFRLCCGNQYSMATVEGWIGAAVRRNVKLLDLKFGPLEDEDPIMKLLLLRTESLFVFGPVMELPRCLVTCGSLEVLKLSLFGYRLSLPKFTGFPALRAFELENCFLLNKNSVKDFLKSCPLLEDLSLINCTTYFLPVLCISCPKLKKVRIDNGNIYDSEYSRIGYEDMTRCLHICCPSLVYLELEGRVARDELILESLDSLKKAVIHPEEDDDGKKVCELLSAISHVQSFSLYLNSTKQNINLEDLPKSLPNLTTLELNMTSDVNALIRILTSSPNIKSLHLIIKEDSSSPTEVDDVDFPIGHIFERLKMVKMTGGITGAVHEIGFIKFVLGSSKVLETITINPSVNMMMTDENLRFLSDDVVKFPRASPEARITFVQD